MQSATRPTISATGKYMSQGRTLNTHFCKEINRENITTLDNKKKH